MGSSSNRKNVGLWPVVALLVVGGLCVSGCRRGTDGTAGPIDGSAAVPDHMDGATWDGTLSEDVVAGYAAEDDPPWAVTPLEGDDARELQGAWAEHLGTEVEVTNSIGMKLRLIPPGAFVMGSASDEAGHLVHEGPQHLVRITRPFFLGACPVTQQQYERVMGENPSMFDGKDAARLPVERVSWHDAEEFCKRLSALAAEQETGRSYRLPSEAEWEYACRAGTVTPFSFGGVLNGHQANCRGDEPYGTREEGPFLQRTTAVGSYGPNPFGLYDVHGNVFEWCADWYDSKYYADSPADDPTGPVSGYHRVCRGGCWNYGGWASRSAARDFEVPDATFADTGFRIVLVVAEMQRAAR